LLVRRIDVTQQPRYPAAFVVVRENPEGMEIRLKEHVRFLDSDEPLDRGPVEHDLAIEGLLELAPRHLDVLVDAQDVGELKPDEVDAEAVRQLQQLALPRTVKVGREALETRSSCRPGVALLAWWHADLRHA
jgi:hypothetical protein